MGSGRATPGKAQSFLFSTQVLSNSLRQRRRAFPRQPSCGQCVREKRGAPLIISLLYTHLAQQLNLPIYLINHPKYCIAKWVRPNASKFIDLTRGGKFLDESQVLQFFNKRKATPNSNNLPFFSPIKTKDLLEIYLNQLLESFKKRNLLNPQHILLNILNQLKPTNLKYLSLRALIRKRMGLYKEAIDDLKKYFSFSGKTRAPKDLKMAYYELQALKSEEASTPPSPPPDQPLH